MSEQKQLDRLTINKETITDLDVPEAEAIKGGTIASTPPHCPTGKTKTQTIAPPPPVSRDPRGCFAG